MSIVLSTDLADAPEVRLTSLAHGGGCGCKLAPSVLQQLLADQPAASPYRQLLVGTETGDDAAVWQIDDKTCVIATTDFFMPMVDDPYDFGRIAATNAISDVYAMGGRPIMALAILGMPLDKIPTEMVREILKGGAAVCAAAGIPVAGGHSIDAPEPIYGLAVIGTCRPRARAPQRRREAGRCADPDQGARRRHLFGGDQEEALSSERLCRDDRLDDAAQPDRRGTRARTQASTRSPTSPASACSAMRSRWRAAPAVRSSSGIRDVPFFARSRGARAARASSPARRSATGRAMAMRWRLPPDMPDWRRHLLTDPQTSGGLLVACAPDSAAASGRRIIAGGYPSARMIGHVEAGGAAIEVKP